MSSFLSFAANLPGSSYFDLLISPTILFLTCSYTYLLNSARLRELLYLLQRRLRFLISFFISLVNHGGSDCTILTIIFGLCFVSAKFLIVIFLAYILMPSFSMFPSLSQQYQVKMSSISKIIWSVVYVLCRDDKFVEI